jgi:hypothetical protein
MANILEMFTTAWTSMPDAKRQKILDEVSPNKVVRGVLSSLSSYYEEQWYAQEHTDHSSEPADAGEEEDVIEAEFVESELDDGFGT